jgi:elongator complex protein 6
VPGRGPPSTVTAERLGNEVLRQREPGTAKKLHFTGHGVAALDVMEKDIIAEINRQKSSMAEGDEMLLIIDQPDFLLAATGASMGIGATEMAEWVTGLQQVWH